MYVPFDKDELKKAELIQAHINLAGCDISREAVLALIHDVSLDQVLAVKAEVAPRRRRPETSVVLGQLVEPYLAALRKDSSATLGTTEHYRDMLRVGWLPYFENRDVRLITGGEIKDLLNSMASCSCKGGEWGKWCARRKANRKLKPSDRHEPGITKRTIDRYYSTLSGLLHYAVREGLLDYSPTRDARYKAQSLSKYNTQRKEETHFYLSQEQFDLVKSKMPEHVQLLIHVIGETGLRFSEVTGLQKNQFRAGAKPSINLNEVPKYSRAEGYVRGAPKGGATRVLRVSTGLGLKLEAACAHKGPEDLIFTTAWGHRITANNFYRDVWNPAIIEAQRCPEHPPVSGLRAVQLGDLPGIRCGDNGGRNAAGKLCGAKVKIGTNRCHVHQGLERDVVSTCDCTDPKFPRRLPRGLTAQDLRHTYNAWMVKWDVPETVRAARMGHTPAVNHAVYAGILDEVDDQLAEMSAID